ATSSTKRSRPTSAARCLAQLRLAMPLQQRAALVGRDRFVELVAAGFEPLDDLLELLQRVLETHRGDLGRQTRVGHGPPPKTGATLEMRRRPSKRGSFYAAISARTCAAELAASASRS